MIEQSILDDYRPYYDNEVPEAVARIASDALFEPTVRFIFPDEDFGKFEKFFRTLDSVDDFQLKVMNSAIGNIIKQTTTSLSYVGLENIETHKNYTYISNHRDIVLDSAILQYILYANGLKTTEITFGSNLMRPQIVVDIGKINKMFKIVREGTAKEMFTNSFNVSTYMRYAILHKNESTWIAQRNGRTKDGDDKTQVALLKMFAMSSPKPFVDNLKEMNIAIISVSYEYEPCDFLKTREIYLTSINGGYRKTENEDLHSIIKGITQFKGNVHYTICRPISGEELLLCDTVSHQEKFRMLADIIDKRIIEGYKLFVTNYMAFDIVEKSSRFAHLYNEEQKESFIDYMTKGLQELEGDNDTLRRIFLNIYANPIKNRITYGLPV